MNPVEPMLTGPLSITLGIVGGGGGTRVVPLLLFLGAVFLAGAVGEAWVFGSDLFLFAWDGSSVDKRRSPPSIITAGGGISTFITLSILVIRI